ncbi:DUF4214 domain-containing protein [Methylobacterium durans]|uniref:DUF4214 domain-containing protein n=1 Tax=Methylobacterium durans TaxID=2202825 RepID=UPI0013A56E6E|nr:DUF4214 domain-containing protein [Methylobacterium durans]
MTPSELDNLSPFALIADVHGASAVVETRAGTSWGLAEYGTLRDAFVFADANGNGIHDANEVSATTAAAGHFDFPAPGAGRLILTGGFDTAMGLGTDGSLAAPAGSLVISALTTLLDRIAVAKGGDLAAAQAVLRTAAGISVDADVMRLDAVAGVQLGQASVASVYAADAILRDTITLLHQAGATADVYAVLTADPALLARILDRGDADWTTRYEALLELARDAGAADLRASGFAAVAAASNALVAATTFETSDPLAYLTAIGAISRTAQGETARDLRAAGTDANAILDTVRAYTGEHLSAAVSANLSKVGPFPIPIGTAVLGDGTVATPFDGHSPSEPAQDTSALLFGTFAGSVHEAGGQVYAIYQAVLGRAPDTLGLEYWADALEKGLSSAGLAKALLASSEYHALAATSGAPGFIEDLYHNVLHRGADATGLQFFMDALEHGATPADIAAGVATSAEAQTVLGPAFAGGLFVPNKAAADVARLYYATLGRAPDADGLRSFTIASETGLSKSGVAKVMLDSLEFGSRFGALDASEFVDHLYVGALGRHAEASGFQFWTDVLKHGASHADVAVAITDSAEAFAYHAAHIEQGWHLAA